MNPIWIILTLILFALAGPAVSARNSWLWLVPALMLSFFGVVLPLFVFFFSAFMVPEWKGACAHGWVDCFIMGKLALTPFVLAATTALYQVEILRNGQEKERWVVVAFFLGAVIATVCFVFGLVSLGWQRWLLVPLYTAVWYAVRSVQFISATRFGWGTYLTALLGSAPFWILSGFWSRYVFESLPDKAPSGCFIVTAASRGHERCVGPCLEIVRNGRTLRANHQLMIFWQFEDVWRQRAPRSHWLFRKVYNRVGPLIAARIQSPWLADAVYLGLKPAEFAVEQINRKAGRAGSPPCAVAKPSKVGSQSARKACNSSDGPQALAEK